MTSGTGRARTRVLLERMRQPLAVIESGELPADPAYRHRVESDVVACCNRPYSRG